MAAARVALLVRGERTMGVPARGQERLGGLISAFADLDVEALPVLYADDAIEDVRAELLSCDGVLVWVNPIQDGATRAELDPLLREVAAAGVWVSAHPDVIDTMGTKEVLFTTRTVGWGTDTAIYRTPEELSDIFPVRLAQHRRLVLKQARGTGGSGVWRVELPAEEQHRTLPLDAPVLVQRSEPRTVTPLEPRTLQDFLAECHGYFEWSGSLIDQPYQDRLHDGMIRVYLVQDQVVGFCHQWPKGLLDPTDNDERETRPPATMQDADTPAYAALRHKAETEWVPHMTRLLDLRSEALPAIWDADFFYGAKNDAGEDTYVLCEINVQAVWPYPPQANPRLAQAALNQILNK